MSQQSDVTFFRMISVEKFIDEKHSDKEKRKVNWSAVRSAAATNVENPENREKSNSKLLSNSRRAKRDEASQNSPLYEFCALAENGLPTRSPVQLYPINKTLHIHPSTFKAASKQQQQHSTCCVLFHLYTGVRKREKQNFQISSTRS